MRNVSNKSCREDQNPHFTFGDFSENRAVYDGMSPQNMVEPERTQASARAWCIGKEGKLTPALVHPHPPTHTHLHTHTHNGFVNSPQCYVTRSLPVLLSYKRLVLLAGEITYYLANFTFTVVGLSNLTLGQSLSSHSHSHVTRDSSVDGLDNLQSWGQDFSLRQTQKSGLRVSGFLFQFP